MKIEFYIGAGKDSAGNPIPMEEAWAIRARIQWILTREFGGWTEHPGCTGEWEGIKEPVYRFDILIEHEPSASKLTRISADLRTIARQTCIAVNVVKSDVMFV